MQTNYQVTICYKAIIAFDVKANSEEEAKKIAIQKMGKQRDKMFTDGKVQLLDDNYKADGVLNMDETWNMF